MASTVENFIIHLSENVGVGLGHADHAIEHTREKFMELREIAEGALLFYGIEKSVEGAIEAFNENEQAVAQLRAGIESTGGVAKKTIDELTKSATEMSETTLFKKDQVEKAQSTVLAFSNVVGDSFDKTIKYAGDLSARFGGELSENATKLGMIMNNPTAALGMLRRAHISLSDAQKEQVKTMQASGNLAGAQAILFNALEKAVGGSAEAAAKVGTGGWTLLSHKFDEIKEKAGGLFVEIGDKFLPIFERMGKVLGETFDYLENHKTAVKIVAITIAGLATAIGVVIGAIKTWTMVQLAFDAVMEANPLGLFIIAISAVAAAIYGIVDATEGWGETWNSVTDYMGAVWDNFSTNLQLNWAVLSNDFANMTDSMVSVWERAQVLMGKMSKSRFDQDELDRKKEQKSREWDINELHEELDDTEKDISKGVTWAVKWKDEDKQTDRLKGDKGDKGPTSVDETKAGLSEIKVGAPKTFNIYLNSLNEGGISVTSQTLGVALDDVDKLIMDRFMTILDDVQVMSND